jgi:hypothetical protein
MAQNSVVEGARAFLLWGAKLIDEAHRNRDKDSDGLE